MYEIDKINFLQIGVQGENIARKIEIDMTKWVEDLEADNVSGYSFGLIFKPYNDPNKYPMVTTYNPTTHVLTWRVSNAATQVSGVGYTEVRAQEAESGLVKKTRIIPTAVEDSVSGNETEPPASQEEWVAAVLNSAAAVLAISQGKQVKFEIDEDTGHLMLCYSDDEEVSVDTEWTSVDLGAVNAYAMAVLAGYTGTAAQFSQYMADIANGASSAATSATNAAASATAAAESAADALQHTQSVIETWLGNNIDPDSGYALDRTLALQNAAAPADMVGDLKSALNNVGDISLIEFTNGAYVTTNKSTDGTKTVDSNDIHSNADWSYAFVNCQPGDLFTIHATRGTATSPRLWAFVNSNDILIRKETSTDTLDFETIKAPANAAKVIFNGKTANGIAVYKGVPIIDRAIKWKDSPANNADLNDLGTETAFYNLALANSFQHTPTGYEAANSFRRLLICMKSEDASLCYQVFVCSTDGTVWSRAYIGGDTGWSAWRNDTKALDDRSVAYRNILTGYDPVEETGDDLDSFMTPGIWEIKNTGGNWKPKNYPLNTGGMLTVIGANTSSVARTIQIVANASQFMYRFGKGSSVWYEWQTVFNANAPLFEPDSSNKAIDQILSRVRALEEEHNIDPIPSYYTDHVDSKISTINGLAPTTGGQFAFITDIHINGYSVNGGNAKHSHAILDKITAETGVNKVFDGGDHINGRSTQSYAEVINRIAAASAYAKPDNNTPMFFIGGNHDLGRDNQVAAKISQDALMASSNLFAPYVYGVVYDDASPFQYYFDDDKDGIRYICLCMGMGDGSSSGNYSTVWWPEYESWSNCASFFADALNSTPDGYHVVVFNHISGVRDGSTDSDFSVVGTYTVGQKYMNYMYKMFVAYKEKGTYTDPSGNEYDFSGAAGVPACMIFGHTHRDITGTTDDITDGGVSIGGSIPLFITTTDNCGGNMDADVIRTIGTVSEQAFDVFTVDKTNRKIYVTRIGGGNDRTNGGNGYSY